MNINETIYYPQDEMNTVLIPVTRGCSYNKCIFCSMYKDIGYSQVEFDEIEMQLINIYKYTEKVFLTGAEPLSIGFEKMKKLLMLIKKHLPYCACVASYASIKNIAKYTEEELSELHNLGLRLLYIGFESGSDEVLKFIKKGHTVKDAITQAKKLNKAKLPFNTIILCGIAGKGNGVKNSIAAAKMINQFTTNKVITMNLTIFAGTEIYIMEQKGEFKPSYGQERVLEIKSLIENLNPEKNTIFDTTHPTNIVNIKGVLPQDKEKLLKEVNRRL